MTIFLTALCAYLQAFALLDAGGTDPARLAPFARRSRYPGYLSTATMMGATAAHIVGTSRDLGVDAALPEAVKSLYGRAISAGHGVENWTSPWEAVAKRR
ncbi:MULTISPECIES: hypothetical protein [Amycolatopsis]|uniref:NADPH-dependent reductive aminase-like C-terminal domain-containing protein n=1 Tax=Amycolatopsis sacchari TaxID=115433 RepID=A0A1I3VI38_9PSEU|nr:hypothetical protein [Amycolatopsis sacchari]SFJ94915.1 hypothetical protein SAMN05421835_11127 [Amycolatopsis sacchari]